MQTCQSGVAGPAARSEIERRVSPSALRWPERRTGFDRRASQPITKALRDNVPVLVGLVVVLNVLNLVDFALTSRALAYGAAEANPIMNTIFLSGWENAALFKLGMMFAVSLTILLFRRYRMVLQVAVAGVALYGAVTLYHLVGIAALS